ncbi:MAG: DUF4373 domain-containing protein [Acutalibacteraceae bacterium]|nr:DUF4373 domain-containing protein [Acutalibacteraceae bacterium]
MARPIKKGLDYFPMDVDFYSDRKIRILFAKYGTQGVALYIYLLTEIYRNSFYINVDEDYICIVADDLNIKNDTAVQIINHFCSGRLFDKKLFDENGILTSKGIQLRFQEAVKTRASKRKIFVEKELWLLNGDETLNFIEFTSDKNKDENNQNKFSDNQGNSEEKYQKESKENEIRKEEIITDEENIIKNKSISDEEKIKIENVAKDYNIVYTEKLSDFSNNGSTEIKLPARDGFFLVDNDYLKGLSNKYNNVDVKKSLRKMFDFLTANPDRQRFMCAMDNYIAMWLEQDKEKAEIKSDSKKETSYDITTFEKYDLFE